MRERLIELLFNVPRYVIGTDELADYLIENGVTIPVRCKDCKHYKTITCSCSCQCVSADWYCGDGERK